MDGRHTHQFITEVKLFSGSSLVVFAEGAEPNASVTFQIESQNIRNRERELMLQNSRLGKGKCKAEEQILHFLLSRGRNRTL